MDVRRSPEQRGDRLRRVAGWSLAGLTLAMFATIPLSLSGGVLDRPGITENSTDPKLWMVWLVGAFALSGGALIHLRPRNWIGWLLLASGLLQTANLAFDSYSARALTDPDGSLPLGVTAAAVASMTWIPSLLLLVLVLPPLYPTGRPTSRLWGWHVVCALTGIGLIMVAAGIGPGGVDDTVEGTRLPWEAPDWLVLVLVVPAVGLLVGTTITAMVGTTVRTFRARSPERQQLLLLLTVVALLALSIFLPYDPLVGIAYGLVPVAVVVGVLRYRLLGIEVALRRTLLYVPLTLLVALVIGGLTTVLARLVPDGPLPLVVASAVVAVLVFPVSDRLRRLVDRLCWARRQIPWPWSTAWEPASRPRATDRCPRCWRRSPSRPGRRTPRWWTGRDSCSPSTARASARRSTCRCGTTGWSSRCSGSGPDAVSPGSPNGTPGWWRRSRPISRWWSPPQRLTADLSRERERVTVATLDRAGPAPAGPARRAGPVPVGHRPGPRGGRQGTGPQPRGGPGSARRGPGSRRSPRCARSGGCSTDCGPAPSTSTAWTVRSVRPRRRWA